MSPFASRFQRWTVFVDTPAEAATDRTEPPARNAARTAARRSFAARALRRIRCTSATGAARRRPAGASCGTHTWLSQYRAALLAPATRTRLFAIAEFLDKMPEDVPRDYQAEPFPLQPADGTLASITSRLGVTWRPDPNDPTRVVLLTLTDIDG